MSDELNNIHHNHRSRLRDTLCKVGLMNMPDHNILEFLLFYSVPRADTNEIAHSLIQKFGSISGVFNASYDELLEIESIGESSALFISSISRICQRYMEHNDDKIDLSGPEAVINFLQTKYSPEKDEALYMLCLDPAGDLISCTEIAKYTSADTVAGKSTLIEAALSNKAEKVIFGRSRDGITVPSSNDIRLAKGLVSSFYSMDIKVLDYIIFNGSDAFPLASADNFSSLFDGSQRFQPSR